MAYVIVDRCIGNKDNSCVEVCPVDCIHPTPDEPGYEAAEQLYIDPDECIDCNSCVEACPVDACLADYELTALQVSFLEKNAAYFRGDC
jgi:ferredoxin